MELLGVIALVLVSFVSGTPHGYGVKSGAIAKAESSAASGAFGALPVIPLSIPSGGGFSGSYSKSSSSSFASSSSSSSSSASSFSFSGTNGNGIAGFGCQSTDCKNGVQVPQGSTNNGLQNGGAIASSAAGAFAGASLHTNGDNIGNAWNKCLSGKCDDTSNKQETLQSTPPANNYESGSNCATGQCGPSIQTGNIQNGYGTQQETSKANDLSDSSAKYNNNNYGASPSSCSNGNCRSGVESSSDDQDIFVPLAPSNAPTSTHQKPSEHLTTPYLEPACKDHNCNQGSADSFSNGKPPTSYNVPILGSNPSVSVGQNNQKGSPYGTPNINLPVNCANGNCVPPSSINTAYQNQKPSSPSHSNYPSQSAQSPSCSGYNCDTLSASVPKLSSIQQSSDCNSPNCAGYPSASHDISGSNSQYDSSKTSTGSLTQSGSLGFSVPTSKQEPAYPHQNTFPVHPGISINSVQDNLNPTTNTGSVSSASQSESYHSSKPVTGNLPSSHDAPSYTGGFGGPAGLLNSGTHVPSPSKPNTEIPNSSPVFSPQNTQPVHTGILLPPHLPHNHQSSAGEYTNTGYVVPQQSGPFGTSKPNTPYKIPSQQLPTSTSQSNPSTGIISSAAPYPGHTSFPNVASSQHSNSNEGYINSGVGIQPGHSFTQKPSAGSSLHPQDIPAYTGGFGGSAGTISGNIETTKPHIEVSLPDKEKPTYTGGFGGPAGSFDTGFPVGTQSKPSYEKIPSSGSHLPSDSSHGETSNANVNSGSNTFSDSHGILDRPSGSLVPPSNNIQSNGNVGGIESSTINFVTTSPKPVDEKTNLPSYTGGFGGPTGLLKPHEYSLPEKSSPSALGNDNLCSASTCNPKDVHEVTRENQALPSNTATSSASASATAKAVAYSGGFGGPPGLLKPFDDGKRLKKGQIDFNGKEQPGTHDHSGSGLDLAYGNIVPSNSINLANAGSQVIGHANSGSQANAAAFASSNAFSANHNGGSNGCNTGCGVNHQPTGGSFASSRSLGLSKTGLDELNGVVGASASAKSVAGASAGGLAVGNSFATSSALAHASAGASVKGGYGR